MEVDSLVPIASRTNTWIYKHRIIKGWPLYCTISLAKLTFIKSISSTIPTRLPKLFLPTQNQRRKNWKSDFGKYILPPNYFTFLIKALRRRAEVVSAEIVIAPPRRTIEPVANVRRSGGIIWPFVSSLYIVRLEEFTFTVSVFNTINSSNTKLIIYFNLNDVFNTSLLFFTKRILTAQFIYYLNFYLHDNFIISCSFLFHITCLTKQEIIFNYFTNMHLSSNYTRSKKWLGEL